MDDVLDEWSYAILTWKTGDAEENIHNQQKIRWSFLGSLGLWLNQVVQHRDIALKIKEVSAKVNEIANERARYGLQINRATDEIQRPTSTHIFDKSSISGRDGEKKSVVRMLLAESSQEAQDVDVISLVGLGGIGKTTLAQLAFNDAEVTAHFEKKIWVCVSEPFDEVRIAKAILEQLEGSTPNLAELQSLLPRVSQSINGIRVLLVLDDVWTENHRQWEQLKQSLASCARGSRILVTTRKGAVATMMGTDHRIDIETLSNDACRDMEVVGEYYFQVLATRSFFQDIKKYDLEDFRCKMHDIVHDFAQYMTENECLTVDGNNLGEASVETSIGRVRHLSIMLLGETSFLSSIHRAKGLRSLLIYNSGYRWDGVALPGLFKQLTCIRCSLHAKGNREVNMSSNIREVYFVWWR
ncbi:hypothetical protein OIU76_000070 [Salix suchowensis]|nr:hypothetical protein OIU76_000070 [Salix suchowensis]